MKLNNYKSLAALTLALFAGIQSNSYGDVQLNLESNNSIKVDWNGVKVLDNCDPKLVSHKGGVKEFFDPTTRATNKVYVSSTDAALVVLNKKRKPVFLGKSTITRKKVGDDIVIRETFQHHDTYWQIVMHPEGENALDVKVEVGTAPYLMVKSFNYQLFDLPVINGQGDSGKLRSRMRKRMAGEKALTQKYLGPVKGQMKINYPWGPDSYVPAAVIQGDNLAVGVCRLDIHNQWRADYNELIMAPGSENDKYKVSLKSGWSYVHSFGNFYRQKFSTRYRFRFSKPLPTGDAGYLRLVDAKELWIDYMKELEEFVPQSVQPAFNKDKNNLVIGHYFTSESHYMTEDNPQGYLMKNSEWKDDPWEWTEKINSKMSDEEILNKTGLADKYAGDPVKWVKPMAERLVREAIDTKAQAVIVMKSSTHPQLGELNYIPESHVFHPLLEERVSVEGAVRNWDWVKGDAVVTDKNGKVVARKNGLMIHAADKAKLIQPNRGHKGKQVIYFTEDEVTKDISAYSSEFILGPKDRIKLKRKAAMAVMPAQKTLVGKNIGDSVELSLKSHSWASKPSEFTVSLKITGVERAAIDVWAYTVTDADVELGFLIREDLTVGPPWYQWNKAFDYGNDWQYKSIKRRIQWHRARFGEKCRWFYMDVFGDWTPQFVFEMLRADFPDCFFFAEHPNDVAERMANGYRWFGYKSALEEYVAPNSLSMVLPDLMLGSDPQFYKKVLERVWNKPGYMVMTHRSGRKFVEIMDGE